MRVASEEFEHPNQASRLILSVFEQAAGGSSVNGLPADAGFLVTEEWLGSTKVVKTLGFFESREAALSRMRSRAGELQLQRYRPVNPAA